jgi:hypothetical protein
MTLLHFVFRNESAKPMRLMRPALRLCRAAPLAQALAGCASVPDNHPFRLQPEQRVRLASGPTLSYDSFSDSRCPREVKCIWAGELSYQFTLRDGGAESFSLNPARPAYAPAALHGKRIVLDLAAIAPASLALTAHPVTLTIEAP